MNNNILLQVGDVFLLTSGMQVYATFPERFVYSNRHLSHEGTAKTDIRVGKILEVTEMDKLQLLGTKVKSIHEIVDFVPVATIKELIQQHYKGNLETETIDTATMTGEYVVVEVAMTGGGTSSGMNGLEIYPDGHHIKALKLAADGTFDPDGEEIEFYQSGCFTAMNTDVPVIRTMQI